MPIKKGTEPTVDAGYDKFSAVINKSSSNKITEEISIQNELTAPLKKGDVIGKIVYKSDGKEIGKCDIYVTENIEKINFGSVFKGFLKKCAIIL